MKITGVFPAGYGHWPRAVRAADDASLFFGEPSEPATVCEHGTADRCPGGGDGVDGGDGHSEISVTRV
jgi:hypothetical protein